MRDATDDEWPDRLVAEIVDDRRSEILRLYQERLSGLDGRTRSGPHPSAEEAAAVLDETRRRLATVTPVAADGRAPRPGDGAFGAAERPVDARQPAADAARASAALVRAAVQTVAAGLPAGPESALAVGGFAAALHESIVGQLVTAADGYTGYLLDRLHRSHMDERRRVARDLHDLIAHSVAVVLQNLELAVLNRDRDQDRARVKLDTALDHLRETLDMLRAVSRSLRQSVAAAGLAAALRSYLRDASFGRATDIRVTGDESAVPSAVQGELFLVLREALRNAHVHGAPSTVRVSVDIRTDEVRAEVRDDGRGFGSEAERDHALGTGMVSMRERVALLGGVIDVHSTPSEGTTVTVQVPLTRAWDEPEN